MLQKPIIAVLIFLLAGMPALASTKPTNLVSHLHTEPHPESGVSLEIETTSPTSEAELVATVEWAKKSFSLAQRENPDLKPEVGIVDAPEESDKNAVSTERLREIASQITDGKESQVHRESLTPDELSFVKRFYQKWFVNNYRVSFTIIRGVSNFTSVSWGLLLSPTIPTTAAFWVGLAAGSMSSTLHYFNDPVEKWTIGTGKFIPKWTRSYLVGFSYLAVLKTVGALAGTAHMPLSVTLASIAKTAFLGVLAQSPWGLSIGAHKQRMVEQEGLRIAKKKGILIDPKLGPKELNKLLNELVDKHAPEQMNRFKRNSSKRVLAISMIAVGVGAAHLMGVPLANFAMYGLGVGGGITYLWTGLKTRKWKFEKRLQMRACETPLTE